MDTEAANGAAEMCVFALTLPLPKAHLKLPEILSFQWPVDVPVVHSSFKNPSKKLVLVSM